MENKEKMTEEKAKEKYNSAMEDGWRPPSEGKPNCSCHISAPCSSCCLDGDYFDEWCEEHDVDIIKQNKEVEGVESIVDELSIFLKTNPDEAYYKIPQSTLLHMLKQSLTKAQQQGIDKGIKQSNSGRKMYQQGREDIKKEIKQNIGMLRQWLNEDRITDKEMVTNEDLEHWLLKED